MTRKLMLLTGKDMGLHHHISYFSLTSLLIISRRIARRTPNINSYHGLHIKCVSTSPDNYDSTVRKQFKHYQHQPTIWKYDFVESLRSNFAGETYMHIMEERKKEVQVMLEKATTPLAQLELINVIQRLGMSYLFEEEIKRSLQKIHSTESKHNKDVYRMKDNLYATALKFRLLRQYGFQVSQDVFKGYKQAKGDFIKGSMTEDVKGILSLYEAAHLVSEGENILEEAIVSTARYLKHITRSANNSIDPNLANQVSRSLEIPLHWRMQRSEVRWFMEAYESEKDMNPVLLELAKLNFNMVQATHQNDLINMSRWWRNLGVATKLDFARDRLVQSFLSSIGISEEPQNGRCREWLTKVMNFVLVIDDIYDIYGSLEELELFTNAVERWDAAAAEKLPYNMKLCFLALYNTINQMAFEVLKEEGLDILSYLTKSWANFIKAMLMEANWCDKGYTPSLEEYMDNGWLSSSGSVFLVHAFFATKQNINTDVLLALKNSHNLFYHSSMMCRLVNDLATSSAELARGDVASSIHCHMRQTNSSEKEAREHIRGLIMDTWKKLNSSIRDSPFDLPFVNLTLNLSRTVMTFYQHGDGIGEEISRNKDLVLSLIVNPVPTDMHLSS